MIEKNDNRLEELYEQVIKLESLVKYQPGAVVSRTLVDKKTVTLTLFAFDKDQTLSEHTAPHDAFLQVLEGKAKVIIDNHEYELSAGESIIMPADVPHAVQATDKFKMYLTMVK
jgi:quercetin dioxygenase-like cupin family protein